MKQWRQPTEPTGCFFDWKKQWTQQFHTIYRITNKNFCKINNGNDFNKIEETPNLWRWKQKPDYKLAVVGLEEWSSKRTRSFSKSRHVGDTRKLFLVAPKCQTQPLDAGWCWIGLVSIHLWILRQVELFKEILQHMLTPVNRFEEYENRQRKLVGIVPSRSTAQHELAPSIRLMWWFQASLRFCKGHKHFCMSFLRQ